MEVVEEKLKVQAERFRNDNGKLMVPTLTQGTGSLGGRVYGICLARQNFFNHGSFTYSL